MQNMKSVLVVTDEPTVSGPIVQVLRREGHAVDIAANVAPGLDVAVRSPHDLVILDLARTDLDGADLCQQMREGGVRAPVLVLTTRCGETDIVVALDAGADDYVIRPFRVAELLARVRALLRRGDHARENTDRSITMDRGARLAFLNGRELTLTAKEFDILAVLLREQGNVVTRTMLIGELWSGDRRTKTLDMHVAALRRSLGDDATRPALVTTIRGIGFRLENKPQADRACVQPPVPPTSDTR